jgi:hypothetical protein
MSSSRSVGVDFGTTTSLVSEGIAGRQPVVFPIGRTTTYLPSLVGMGADDAILFGDDAADLPVNRVKRSIKRCITHNEDEITLGDGTTLSADDGIRGVLAALAREARVGGLNLSADTTRLGCPAMWTGPQRQRLLTLAGEAGLPVSDHTLIDEPVAAGVAWVQQQRARSREVQGKLLVIDMGGGTLDVALLDIYAELGLDPEISVLSSWGVDEAGDALDDAIAADLEMELTGLGVDVEHLSQGVVVQAALEAKLQLTHELDTVVAVRDPRVSIPHVPYSRERLEVAFAPQLQRAQRLIRDVLRGAHVTYEEQRSPSQIRQLTLSDLAPDVDYVLLAGGMARVPAVAEMVDALFPGVDLYTDAGVPTDEAIVAGLGETIAYERVNLHRPPFSFVLEYERGGLMQSVPVYNAYEPFYEPWFAMQREILYHEWRPRRGSLPETGHGWLRIYTAGGEPVQLRLAGESAMGAVRVPFGHVTPAVTIRPDGRVGIQDGRNTYVAFRIPRWPVIRGSDYAVLELQRIEAARRPVISKPWHNDPLFLH